MLVLTRRVGEQVQCFSHGLRRTVSILSLGEARAEIAISKSFWHPASRSQDSSSDEDNAPQTNDQQDFHVSKEVGDQVSFMLGAMQVHFVVVTLDRSRVQLGFVAPTAVSILRSELFDENAPLPPVRRKPRRATLAVPAPSSIVIDPNQPFPPRPSEDLI